MEDRNMSKNPSEVRKSLKNIIHKIPDYSHIIDSIVVNYKDSLALKNTFKCGTTHAKIRQGGD